VKQWRGANRNPQCSLYGNPRKLPSQRRGRLTANPEVAPKSDYFRIGDYADRTPDESDMRKGGLAGQLIFNDALPAEIKRAG
jgi:hypothetical protein